MCKETRRCTHRGYRILKLNSWCQKNYWPIMWVDLYTELSSPQHVQSQSTLVAQHLMWMYRYIRISYLLDCIVVPIPELTGPTGDPSCNFMGRMARVLLGRLRNITTVVNFKLKDESWEAFEIKLLTKNMNCKIPLEIIFLMHGTVILLLKADPLTNIFKGGVQPKLRLVKHQSAEHVAISNSPNVYYQNPLSTLVYSIYNSPK